MLDIDSIPWPAGLRAMMQMFNGMFNINRPSAPRPCPHAALAVFRAPFKR
jgi:hypothetical protein